MFTFLQTFYSLGALRVFFGVLSEIIDKPDATRGVDLTLLLLVFISSAFALIGSAFKLSLF